MLKEDDGDIGPLVLLEDKYKPLKMLLPKTFPMVFPRCPVAVLERGCAWVSLCKGTRE